ncbi:MAG: type II secretion system protein [Planctomycetes bacterium]|nr:type II secretion system protein [Planctomycetota bacterium]MBI3847963.1 type II secretion system protein [Planctomycetota bacterium]
MKATARAGFSLIELIIVLVTTALVGSILGITFVGFGDDFDKLQTRKALEREAWGAIERMRREIQHLRSSTLEDVLAWTSTNFQFRDATPTTIQFQLVGTQVQRNGVALLDGVTQFSVSYLAANATAAARVGDIRRVVVSLTALRGSEKISLRTEITPRSATYPITAWSEP